RSPSRAASSKTFDSATIVRGVLRDRDVVRMALAEACAGDADEPRLLERLEVRRAAVTHRLADAADELQHDVPERSLVRHSTLDTLRDELVGVLDVAPDVTCLRAPGAPHPPEPPPAPVLLAALAGGADPAPGRLVRSGQHGAEHARLGPRRERLGAVARGRDAAVGDHRDAVLRRDP